MIDDDTKQLRDTREALLLVGAKLDAFNARTDDDHIRLLKVETLFEIERAKIAAFEPLIPAVFGAAGQAAGLVERTSHLELRVVTWPQAAAIASFCGVLSSIAATITLFRSLVTARKLGRPFGAPFMPRELANR